MNTFMQRTTADRFQGRLLGLALGDSLGAPHERGPLERQLCHLMGTIRSGHMRWTDDTQMPLDLADSLLADHHVGPSDLARRFADSFRWHRGQRPSAARILEPIKQGQPWDQANRAVHREGAFGNGAGMRSPVVALFCSPTPDHLKAGARFPTEVARAHPLASADCRLRLRSSDSRLTINAVRLGKQAAGIRPLHRVEVSTSRSPAAGTFESAMRAGVP